jgi:hypothetical protein
MKYILGILVCILAGCAPSATEKVWPVMPEGLRDCKIYNLTDGNGNRLTVARCPLSATSVRESSKLSITIDSTEAAK